MAKLKKGFNDLETFCIKNNRADLLEEWDYNKNNGINPSDVCYGSSKKYWWKGKCGHSFYSSLNRRTANSTGCPYCCDSHARILPGFNDLATTNPDIISSWDYEKNGELKPNMVMKGQHKKVWWKGSCGHSWQSSIYHRVQGKGCPICKKESKTSFPEQAIFYYVKKSFPDAESGNITILNGKELDIYIPSINVGIEFDGSKWHLNKEKDEQKNHLCEQSGVQLYRIRDIDCPQLSPNSFVHIIDYNSYTDESLEDSLRKLSIALGVSFEVSLFRDRIEIYNQFLAQRKEASLGTLYPLLSKEWNYERNKQLTPDLVTPMSNKKVWWKCEKGHEWQSIIHARTKGSGCPYCNNNRLLKGFNDLETVNPNILKYWNYNKNNIQPDEVTATTSKKVWWHCYNCGNDFMSSVRNKIKFPDSCPYCAHRLPQSNINDLYSINPSLAKEWDYDNNEGLTPKEVLPNSSRKVWWKCENGHSYQSTIYNRTSGKGCPYCSGHAVLVGFNDFEHKHPELAGEWDYKKNNCLPNSVTEHSGKKVWWKCEKGHEWQATVDSRSNGAGCPFCSGNHKRAVRNIDTNIVYSSLREAAKSCGLTSGDTISLCCLGKQKKAGGYHWEFVYQQDT